MKRYKTLRKFKIGDNITDHIIFGKFTEFKEDNILILYDDNTIIQCHNDEVESIFHSSFTGLAEYMFQVLRDELCER